MIQVAKLSKEEKIKMYSKISKRKLIEMLIEANNHIDSVSFLVQPLAVINCPQFNPKLQDIIDGIETKLKKK